MRRFFMIFTITILSAWFVAPPTNSFAACSAGYYEEAINITYPTADVIDTGFRGLDGSYNYNSGNLSNGQWSNSPTWGTAIGISTCNNVSGTLNSTQGSNDSWTSGVTGGYCWCKLTQWISSDGTTQSLDSKWALRYSRRSKSECAKSCAANCAWHDETFHSVVFGSVTNTPTTCATCPDGGISATGATSVTQCYIPTNTNFNDAAGTWHYSQNCYYTE